jgi:hypothetical protein
MPLFWQPWKVAVSVTFAASARVRNSGSGTSI